MQLLRSKRLWALTLTLLVIVAGVVVLVLVRCAEYQGTRDRWDARMAHLSGPPSSWPPSSWSPPPNDLVRFYDTGSTYNSYGLTMPRAGFQDANGTIVIPARFAAVDWEFSNGYAWAHDIDANTSGYIDASGEFAVITPGHAVSYTDGKIFKFRVQGSDGVVRFGFCDADSNVMMPARYESISFPVDGYVMVENRTIVGRVTYLLDWIGMSGVRTCLDYKPTIMNASGVPQPNDYPPTW